MQKPVNYKGIDKAALRTAQLIAGYINQTLSEDENKELGNWLNESRDNLRLFENLTNPKYINKMNRQVKRI